MKNLITLIDEEIKRLNINAKEMAGQMCIPEGTLSRMRYGVIKDIDADTLVKMQEGVADDPDLQRRLLVAYLKDKAVGPASESILYALEELAEKNGGLPTRLMETPIYGGKSLRAKDEYAALAEKARELKLSKPMIAIFIRLMEMLKKSPNLRTVLKGLAAG